jgi:hypothetical protein
LTDDCRGPPNLPVQEPQIPADRGGANVITMQKNLDIDRLKLTDQFVEASTGCKGTTLTHVSIALLCRCDIEKWELVTRAPAHRLASFRWVLAPVSRSRKPSFLAKPISAGLTLPT